MLIPRGGGRGCRLGSSAGKDALLGAAASGGCGEVSSLLPRAPARAGGEAGELDVLGREASWQLGAWRSGPRFSWTAICGEEETFKYSSYLLLMKSWVIKMKETAHS